MEKWKEEVSLGLLGFDNTAGCCSLAQDISHHPKDRGPSSGSKLKHANMQGGLANLLAAPWWLAAVEK